MDGLSKCTRCGENNNVYPRYSFGVYAGKLCEDCCMKYRDHCGIDQGEGSAREFMDFADEEYYEEDDIDIPLGFSSEERRDGGAFRMRQM